MNLDSKIIIYRQDWRNLVQENEFCQDPKTNS